MTAAETYAATSGVRFFSSYHAALAWTKKNPGQPATWDGGEGWVCEGQFCPRLKRQVSSTWNPTTGARC